jgi:hypothetical protein
VFAVKYELGFYIPEDDILHSRRGILHSDRDFVVFHCTSANGKSRVI